MVFSRFKNSVLMPLLGGLMVALFLGWFVLPSCHCQWEALFGDDAAPAHSSTLSFSLDGPGGPDFPCCCDDAPTKVFEVTDGDGSPGSPPVSPFHHRTASHLNEPKRLVPDCFNRGPPPRTRPHHSEPRAYLRHRSLIL